MMAKVALVTGASSGIGEAIAADLLKQNYIVYAGARRLERMRSLEAHGARLLSLDLTNDPSMSAAVAQIVSEVGRIDALVNNAGYGAYGALEDIALDEARHQVEVNLFGLSRLTQLVLPTMRAQRSGRIVNVSSIGGKIHEPMGAWYHATKFAVEGLSDCLRMELAPFGIDVVVIQPGAIKTEWSAIARESLLETSGSGPYAEQARVTAVLLAGADSGNGSPPDVVARAVSQALSARRPKTRYVIGGGAKPLIAMRWLLSDRAFDGLMRAAARTMARKEERAAENEKSSSRASEHKLA